MSEYVGPAGQKVHSLKDALMDAEAELARQDGVVKALRAVVGQFEPDWEKFTGLQKLSLAGAKVALAALAQDAEQRQTHGRDCPCTPCQREDWDAIERALAQDAEQARD